MLAPTFSRSDGGVEFNFCYEFQQILMLQSKTPIFLTNPQIRIKIGSREKLRQFGGCLGILENPPEATTFIQNVFH